MGTPARLHGYSFAEYLELEAASNVKHEFLEGEIYGIPGATPRHAALTLAIGGALWAQLRGTSCGAFSSDLRVRVLSTYPDVAVVCGPLELDPNSESTVTNPRVLVEVLSCGTQAYDLGEKFEQYKRIPSVREVVYVWQTEPHVEVRRLADDGAWTSETYAAGGVIRIDSIGCTLAVNDIYRDAAQPQ